MLLLMLVAATEIFCYVAEWFADWVDAQFGS